jgi:hypothetical protein
LVCPPKKFTDRRKWLSMNEHFSTNMDNKT